jgi:hypothetical protein
MIKAACVCKAKNEKKDCPTHIPHDSRLLKRKSAKARNGINAVDGVKAEDGYLTAVWIVYMFYP